MKATINPSAKTKFTTSHRKEGKCYFESYSAIVRSESKYNPDQGNAVVDLRLYGTGTTWYACIWVQTPEGPHLSGSGSAGGYGHHKPSAAASEAIRNAGIELSQDISGRGDESIRGAVKAIADAIGQSNALIFKSHA